MGDTSDFFDNFGAHTRLKHAIYRAYIERWPRILGSRYNHLRIVDACAGTGSDESGRPGSPVIAVVEADRAAKQMTEIRGEAVTVEVLAIEKDPAHFAELAARMSIYGERHRAHHGTLADLISELEREFRKIPTFFFIDPFGLEPLQADVVRRALAGPKSEVFLLFADQAALRHVGAADAIAAADENAALEFDFGDSPAPPTTVSRASEITGQRANEILNAAFDGLDWRQAAKVPRPRRRQAFVDLYCDLLRRFGATHVLALPIYDRSNAPKYHLIHATKSGRGYEVMKEAIEYAWRAGLVEARAVEMMRLGTQISDTRLQQAIEAQFAGAEVAWTSKDSKVVTVRRYALQETPAMPGQLSALKKALARFRVPGRRDLFYRFPPRTHA